MHFISEALKGDPKKLVRGSHGGLHVHISLFFRNKGGIYGQKTSSNQFDYFRYKKGKIRATAGLERWGTFENECIHFGRRRLGAAIGSTVTVSNQRGHG